jgi:hypothetical protein
MNTVPQEKMRGVPYVPGETDIYALPKDILISILTRIEQDTAKHYEDKKRKLDDLEFQVSHCNCEFSLQKCSIAGCDARVLYGGKYDDVHDKCNKIYSCKICMLEFCDKHIGCKVCRSCPDHLAHTLCKYCDVSFCPKSQHVGFASNIPGTCGCGRDLEKVKDYYCGPCIQPGMIAPLPDPLYDAGICARLSRIYATTKYHECAKCASKGCRYAHVYYLCSHCSRRDTAKECGECGLKRHLGCHDFGDCFGCGSMLCPRCMKKCKNCKLEECNSCAKEHLLCRCGSCCVETTDKLIECKNCESTVCKACILEKDACKNCQVV